MLDADLIDISDAILAESLREFARFSDEGVVHEERGVLVTVGGRRHPGLSFVMRTRDQGPPPEELVQLAGNVAAGRSRGFTVRLRGSRDVDLGQYLRGLSGVQAGQNLGLVREGTLPEQRLAPGLRVDAVDSLSRAAEFREVVSIAFRTVGVDEDISRHIFASPARLLAPHLRAVLVRDGDRSVSAALCLLARGGAGIYWVGTLPGARGRGLAGHAVRAVHNWAVDHGARAVTLQCAPIHTRFYESIGYRTLLRYPWYMVLSEGDARAASALPLSLVPGDS